MIVHFIFLLILNIAAYMMMSIDKNRARFGGRRIPERTLLLTAAAGGSVGVWLAMQRKKHKTKHANFRMGIPILVVLHGGILVFLCAR